MNEDEYLKSEIQKYNWFHSFKLNDNVSIKGVWETDRADMIEVAMSRLDYDKKSVLDVGCRDGYFSFFAENAGAASVHGVDTCLSHGARDLLIPYWKSKVTMQEIGLYDLDDTSYDIVLFLGVLYHLRYPFWALKILVDRVNEGGKIVIETALTADTSDKPLLFCPTAEDSPYQDNTSVTFFNLKGLKDALFSLGVQVDYVDYKNERDGRLNNGAIIRSCVTGTKVGTDAFRDAYWLGQTHDRLRKNRK